MEDPETDGAMFPFSREKLIMTTLYLWGPGTDRPEGAPPTVIRRFPCVIGRQADCAVRLADPLVSRRHCSLTLREGRVWIEDLGSRNGTRLNGQPLEEALPLDDGDQLEVAHLLFRVGLGSESEEALSERDASAAANEGAGRAVLVVEDDDALARTLARLLESWGHRVRVARDGPEALREAKASPPEVVFLDIGLPGMSGLEVARRLRAEPGLRHARLVAVTGDEKATEVLQARAGFEQLLVKPVSPRVLLEALGRAG
jgi:CheY-like chemotaxis protein